MKTPLIRDTNCSFLAHALLNSLTRKDKRQNVAEINQNIWILSSKSSLVFTSDASTGTTKRKGKILPSLSLCICLRRGRFHCERSTLMLAFVLTSLRKTRLFNYFESVTKLCIEKCVLERIQFKYLYLINN